MECWHAFGRVNYFGRRLLDSGECGREGRRSLVVFAGGTCGIVLGRTFGERPAHRHDIRYVCALSETKFVVKVQKDLSDPLEIKNSVRQGDTLACLLFNIVLDKVEFDIVNFIKIKRIKWAGHVIRMNEDRTTEKVFNAQPIGTQRKSRPNLRWIDGLEKGLLVLRTRHWRTLAWKRILEKAKAHPRLSGH
ncbi:uncharacterized protein TNCV_3117771 [Trichonephila clavipes]|uniref:Uncharacterized protein n=1 Tax=Trichonephila clavipes TaxID=2585209 RepID=A0A8X7BGN2_TRICX|nr:uncharacterized protein TNCV_3117771 [Trichonephila clavipes]